MFAKPASPRSSAGPAGVARRSRKPKLSAQRKPEPLRRLRPKPPSRRARSRRRAERAGDSARTVVGSPPTPARRLECRDPARVRRPWRYHLLRADLTATLPPAGAVVEVARPDEVDQVR